MATKRKRTLDEYEIVDKPILDNDAGAHYSEDKILPFVTLTKKRQRQHGGSTVQNLDFVHP
jgi:hypothetical protein